MDSIYSDGLRQYRHTEEVETAIAYLKEAGIRPYKMFFYMLVKDGQIEDAEKRALLLDSLGCVPFAMAYRDLDKNHPPTIEQKRFARWVNMKATFKSCRYSDYKQ